MRELNIRIFLYIQSYRFAKTTNAPQTKIISFGGVDYMLCLSSSKLRCHFQILEIQEQENVFVARMAPHRTLHSRCVLLSYVRNVIEDAG